MKVEDLARLLAVTVALENHFFFEDLDERNVWLLRVEDDDVVGFECGEVHGIVEFLPEDFTQFWSASVFGGEDD